MGRARWLIVAVLLGACQGPNAPADLVFVDGRVVTLSDVGIAEALAVRGERIIAIGTSAEIHGWAGPSTRVVQLAGRTMIPGLADNHYHGIGGGPGVDLSRARSLGEVLDLIANAAGSMPPGAIVVTNSNWHEGQLAEQRLPYRDDLDEAAPDHPVVVVRGGHEYILNSAALEKWDIRESAAEPAGGRIGRYEDGRLNGELVDRAKDPVSLPPRASLDAAASHDALVEEYQTLHSRGLTSIRYPGASPAQYELLQQLKNEGRLSMRVNFLFRAPAAEPLHALVRAIEAWPDPSEGDAWLGIGGVKLGVDGGFEGGLMREPYAEPWGVAGSFHGLQTLPTEHFVDVVLMLHRRGWRVATHAVGDAAIDLVLDAYEVANEERSIEDLRWVIEHGFIPRDDHFARMRALGLSVSAQNHLYVAAPSLVSYWGADRAAWTTPLRAYLDADIPISLGTDSPVIPYDPWWVLHHFTTRGTISAGVLDGSQAISREEALRAASAGFAHLTFEESEKGTLEVGKLADLVVTAADVLECADPCLEAMEVDLTVIGGRVVYDRGAERTGIR